MEYLFFFVIAIAIGTDSDDKVEQKEVDLSNIEVEAAPQANDTGRQRYVRNKHGYLETSLPHRNIQCSSFLLAKLDSETYGQNNDISANKINIGCQNEK